MAISVVPNMNNSSLLIGEIKAWPGLTIPEGWMLCDGSPISRTLYVDLYTVLGTTWGEGDGETTFNIPNLSGKTLISAGEDSSINGHSSHSLGEVNGEEKHTLIVDEIPSHSHSYEIWTSKGIGWDRTYHNIWDYAQTGSWWNSTWLSLGGGGGGNGAHNNMMPYATVNYIIYTGVVE